MLQLLRQKENQLLIVFPIFLTFFFFHFWEWFYHQIFGSFFAFKIFFLFQNDLLILFRDLNLFCYLILKRDINIF